MFRCASVGFLLGFTGCCTGANDTVLFAAPYSGGPVTGYDIQLPGADRQRRQFQIPADCADALSQWGGGAARWGTRVERRLWAKVINDCEFARLTAGSQRHAEQQDLVSTENFMDLSLATLAIARPCAQGQDGCVLLQPPFDYLQVQPTLAEGGPCRVVNGVFRARIGSRDGELICQEDQQAPGFRIMSAYCADIDGDNKRDAMLRVLPLRAGKTAEPMTVILSREYAGGPFEIVQKPLPTGSGIRFSF